MNVKNMTEFIIAVAGHDDVILPHLDERRYHVIEAVQPKESTMKHSTTLSAAMALMLALMPKGLPTFSPSAKPPSRGHRKFRRKHSDQSLEARQRLHAEEWRQILEGRQQREAARQQRAQRLGRDARPMPGYPNFLG